MHWAKNVLFCEGDTMNIVVLIKGALSQIYCRYFGERNTKRIPGIRQAICLRFRGKQGHDPKTKWFSDGSKRFRYFSIYDAKKTKTNSTFSLRLGPIRSQFHPKTFCLNSS